MAKFKYSDLQGFYSYFQTPFTTILINNKALDAGDYGLVVTQVHMELTSGYEASICSFKVANTYDLSAKIFRSKEIKDLINIGAPVEVSLGYSNKGRTVFLGFITKIDFVKENFSTPYVEITAMDVKSIMMANRYSYQLKATNYSDAVKEILNKSVYKTLQQKKCITGLDITATPDSNKASGEGGKAVSVDMIAESDYEFVVRAAKRFNFEFFTECGKVYFRKAKVVKDVLIELSDYTGLLDYDVSYDLTGLVEEVEARGLNVGKGELITASNKNSGKLSGGNMASPLIKGTKKVVIDPTVSSEDDAKERAAFLLEDMSYRFGTLNARLVGLPELLPGNFIELKNLGDVISNKFYITDVIHNMDTNRGFSTTIIGKAAEIT